MSTPSPGHRTAPPSPQRPIFVSGCPRSGTTLLTVMLHAHRRIAIPPEDRELLETYHRRHRFGDLRDPDHHRRLARQLARARRFRIRPAVLEQAVLDAPPTLGSALGALRQAYADKFDKPRWGDKRPAFLVEYEVVLRLFPDAQLIHIVRDGRACAASLKRMPWWHSGVVGATARWVESMEAAERLRRQLAPDQYLELRYEDLVADPRAAAERLCRFVGEDFDEAMLAHETVAAVAVPLRKRNQRQTREPINARAVETWREQLSAPEVALIERAAGRLLTAHGYALSEPGAEPSRRTWFRYLGQRALLGARRRAKRWRDRAQRTLERRPVAAQPVSRAGSSRPELRSP